MPSLRASRSSLHSRIARATERVLERPAWRHTPSEGQIREVFAITKLDKIFPIYDTSDEALNSLS